MNFRRVGRGLLKTGEPVSRVEGSSVFEKFPTNGGRSAGPATERRGRRDVSGFGEVVCGMDSPDQGSLKIGAENSAGSTRSVSSLFRDEEGEAGAEAGAASGVG
jgi:hypothetical protein